MNLRGDGKAMLAFSGAATIGGLGTLRYKDGAGDSSVSLTGAGAREDGGDGWTRYVGFAGTATLSGSSLEVVLTGGELTVVMTGAGTAKLFRLLGV